MLKLLTLIIIVLSLGITEVQYKFRSNQSCEAQLFLTIDGFAGVR